MNVMQSVLVSSQTFCDGGRCAEGICCGLRNKFELQSKQFTIILPFFCQIYFLLMSKNKPFMSQQHTQITHCNKMESFGSVGAGYNIGGFNILNVQLVLYMCDLDCLAKS